VIRAYVPWYLVRNYLAFAFIASLGALQLAAAHRSAALHRRMRYAFALAVLASAFLSFYAFAPELLTPGPAGGEMMFLAGGAALLAIIITRLVRRTLAARSFPLLSLACEEAPSLPVPHAAAETVDCISIHAHKRRGSCLCYLDKCVFWASGRFRFFCLAGLSVTVLALDMPLFRALNSLALCTPLIDVPVQFLMNDYIVPTALTLILLSLWFAGRDQVEQAAFQRIVLRAMLALALASITLKLINQVYFRPRPFTLDESVRLLFYHPSDSTMPSNAATVCSAWSFAVWLRHKRWGTAMLILAAGMVLARVIGGVHYPADIVAGAWLGGSWAWLVNRATWLDCPLDAVVALAQRMGLT